MPLAYRRPTSGKGEEVMAGFYRCDRCGQENPYHLRVDKILTIGRVLDEKAFKLELCDLCIKDLKVWAQPITRIY